ncbi:MAG: UbiD family decarboxylase [Nitrososphaerota archaeon]|nr:UbiD family decarboxylase [Nitrososphaerota archaeon]
MTSKYIGLSGSNAQGIALHKYILVFGWHMPNHDMREFIERIDRENELVRITENVDWNLEIGAVVYHASRIAKRPALLFENIKDYQSLSFFTGALNNFEKYSLAMDLPKNTTPMQVIKEYRDRLSHPIKPREVSEGICQENVELDDEIDLLKFPTPKWHPRDGGRYFGTFHGTVTRDPELGWINVGLYRHAIHDKKTLGIYWSSGAKHAWEMYRKYQSLGKPMPIAIVVGQDPVNVMAAFATSEIGISEWDIAGGLRKSPVELVKCKTSDLLIPASAEIVVEGEIPVDVKVSEGPFGEFTGYYGGIEEPRPVIKVKAITHRNKPILTGSIESKPIIENHIMTTVQTSAFLEKLLIDDMKLGVRSAYSHPASGMHTAIVSMRQQYPGHAKRVAHAIWGAQVGTTCSHVIVVGEDIDPTNLDEVLWAICTRCLPDRDITILNGERVTGLWPALDPSGRKNRVGSKVLIEAAFPPEWPDDWVPKVVDERDWKQEVYSKAARLLDNAIGQANKRTR